MAFRAVLLTAVLLVRTKPVRSRRAFDPGRDELMLLQWTADERYYYR